MKKILIVDDDTSFMFAIKCCIENLGISSIETASNGENAIYKIKGQPFDLVITDIQLWPMGASGVDVAKKAKAKNIPVIGMSSDNPPPNLEADYFLKKGHFSLAELEEKIKTLLKITE